MGKFRVAVTPYYASLMDPDDEHCPVRMQGVPSPLELAVGKAEMKDAIAETIDSPTTLITHRYPDRVLFITTEMCSMYCRHCTRRRIVGESEGATSEQDYENAFTYIERNHGRARRAAQRRRPAHAVRRKARVAAAARHAPSTTWRSCAWARACRWCARSASRRSCAPCSRSTTRCTSTRTSTTPRRSRPRPSRPAPCWPTPASPWATSRCSCAA